jgi:hypothetical protein
MIIEEAEWLYKHACACPMRNPIRLAPDGCVISDRYCCRYAETRLSNLVSQYLSQNHTLSEQELADIDTAEEILNLVRAAIRFNRI